MAVSTFDRPVTAIHHPHEIPMGHPRYAVLVRGQAALGEEEAEVVYTVEGGFVVQGQTQAVYLGDDGEVSITDMFEGVIDETTVPLKCPDCWRALKKGPLYREATMQVKRTCTGCGAKWSVMLRPKGVERGGTRKATITTADFTRIGEGLDENISASQLASLERAIDKLFAAAGIDVEFTKHFFDRVNDPRNGKPITVEELAGIFREVWAKHRETIAKAKVDWEAIIQDIPTTINIPIVMDVNGRGEVELVVKTVMRKKSFSGREKRLLTVSHEDVDESLLGLSTKLLPLRGALYRALQFTRDSITLERARKRIAAEPIVRFIPTDREIMAVLKDLGWRKRGAVFVREDVDEGVYDPFILKAIFLTGGAGSGKSFVAQNMFGGMGLKFVNSDTALEREMKKAGLDLTHDISKAEVQREGGLRDKAKLITTRQQGGYMQGRLGLIIDSTAAKVGKVEGQVKSLRSLGYDCYMVFVNTSLETALARNQERARTVPEQIARRDHAKVQKNVEVYRRMFGTRNFAEVLNDEVLSPREVTAKLVPQLTRVGMKFLNQPVKNPVGKAWVNAQMANISRGRGALAASYDADGPMLAEDIIMALGLLGSVALGAVLSKIAIGAKRTIEKAAQLHRQGKESAAERVLANLSAADRSQLEALLASGIKQIRRQTRVGEGLEEATIRMIDARTKEVEWEGSLQQFLRDNADDQETVRLVRRLRPGQSVRLGGGASPEVIVQRNEAADCIDEASARYGVPFVSELGARGSAEPYAIMSVLRAPRVNYFWTGKGWSANDGEAQRYEFRATAAKDLGKALNSWRSMHEAVEKDAAARKKKDADKDGRKSMVKATVQRAAASMEDLDEARVGRMVADVRDGDAEFPRQRPRNVKAVETWLKRNPKLLRSPLPKSMGSPPPDEYDATEYDVMVGGTSYVVYVADDFVQVYLSRVQEDEAADESELTLEEHETLVIFDWQDAIREALDGADAARIAENTGLLAVFEQAVEDADYERAENAAEMLCEALQLDEYRRQTMGARMKRLRARRTGMTQAVKAGKVTRTELKRENRQQRRMMKRSPSKRLAQKRYRRRTRQHRARVRPLAQAREGIEEASLSSLKALARKIGARIKSGAISFAQGLDELAQAAGSIGDDIISALLGEGIEEAKQYTAKDPQGNRLPVEIQHDTEKGDYVASVRGGRFRKMASGAERQPIRATGTGATPEAAVKALERKLRESLDEAARISTKDPMAMTAAQINKELDRLDDLQSERMTAMIEAGRGNEKFNEIAKSAQRGDALAKEIMEISARQDALRSEARARYGPRLIGKLPTKGFGPRKRANEDLDEAKGTVRITVKKRQGVWAAVYHLDGKAQEGPTYYSGGTDREDKQDATDTAKAMRAEAKKKGFIVNEDDDGSLDETLRPGHMFVVVDTSVPGGRMIGDIITGVAKADAKAAKLRAAGKDKIQVIDALWYGPARDKLVASGVIAEDFNAHGVEFTKQQLLSMWEEEDEATRGTFAQWRARYFDRAIDEAIIDEERPSLVSRIWAVLSKGGGPLTADQIADRLKMPKTGVDTLGHGRGEVSTQLDGLVRGLHKSKYGVAKRVGKTYAAEAVEEVAPPGFEGTVKAMKRAQVRGDIDPDANLYALAWAMKNKGAKSHRKADGTKKQESTNEARLVAPKGAKIHKGVWYWKDRKAAKAWAEANGWPTDRIISYERGYAVQSGTSGNYAGPGETPRPWRGTSPGAFRESLDEAAGDYRTLNDAAVHGDGYVKGSTEIWYMKPGVSRDYGMGLDFLREGHKGVAAPPTAKTVKDSHVLVGKIAEKSRERVFGMMQGERWSPNGEARTLIRKLGLHHTSMSVGDVVKIGGTYYFCDRMGFKKLS